MPKNLTKSEQGIWQFRMVMPDGTRRSISTKTKNKMEAQKVADKIRAEVWSGNFGFEKEKNIPLGELVQQFLSWCETNHASYGSDRAYAVNLLKHFGPDIFISKIKSWDIECYKKERRKTVKPCSVNHDLTFVKQMFNKAIEWGMIKANPARSVKKLREDNERLRFLSDDERQRLLAACDHADAPWYLGPIVRVAINAGLRRGEILNLKWQDVDTENRILRVAKSKSGKPREIPMNQVLTDLFKSMERQGTVIFPVAAFPRSWASAKTRAGISDLHFHDLRHEFASQLVMSGADLKTVQELLGHSSLVVTQRYAHLSQDHKRKAVERLVDLQRRPEQDDTLKVVSLYKNG